MSWPNWPTVQSATRSAMQCKWQWLPHPRPIPGTFFQKGPVEGRGASKHTIRVQHVNDDVRGAAVTRGSLSLDKNLGKGCPGPISDMTLSGNAGTFPIMATSGVLSNAVPQARSPQDSTLHIHHMPWCRSCCRGHVLATAFHHELAAPPIRRPACQPERPGQPNKPSASTTGTTLSRSKPSFQCRVIHNEGRAASTPHSNHKHLGIKRISPVDSSLAAL